MTARRANAVIWLALMIFMLGAPLLAAAGCEEACDVHCGDCARCPLNAEVQIADPSVAMISADVLALVACSAVPVPARAPDHVPLPS